MQAAPATPSATAQRGVARAARRMLPSTRRSGPSHPQPRWPPIRPGASAASSGEATAASSHSSSQQKMGAFPASQCWALARLRPTQHQRAAMKPCLTSGRLARARCSKRASPSRLHPAQKVRPSALPAAVHRPGSVCSRARALTHANVARCWWHALQVLDGCPAGRLKRCQRHAAA